MSPITYRDGEAVRTDTTPCGVTFSYSFEEDALRCGDKMIREISQVPTSTLRAAVSRLIEYRTNAMHRSCRAGSSECALEVLYHFGLLGMRSEAGR